MPLQVPFSDEPEWELESILGTRITRRNQRMFLVAWKGFPRAEWISLEDMENAATLIVQYFATEGEEVPADVQDFFLQIHSERMEQEANSAEI